MYGRTRRRLALGVAVAALGLVPASQAMAASVSAGDGANLAVQGGTLAFTTAPDVPNLPQLTLNGQAQTVHAQMSDWMVEDATGTGDGWNVTVQGDSGEGKSAVFKEYCADEAACGSLGYVADGRTLAANSLTLSSTGAGFTAQDGTTGTAPAHACAPGCNLDSGSPVKIAAAAAEAGLGTYQAGSYGAESLSLSAPTTVRALGAGKVYGVNLTWTLSSGP